jgi:hypothetical protein
MSREQFDHWVRECFETSPGPAADGAGWLVVDDPKLLSSFEQQKAIERLWFGVQRSIVGQMLALDVCLERYRNAGLESEL